MSPFPKRDRALAEFRQLCTLDVPAQMMLGDLSTAIQRCIPSAQVVFHLPDARGRPMRLMSTTFTPEPSTLELLVNPEALLDLDRKACGHTTIEYFGAGHRFQNSADYGRRLNSSSLYDLILRPADSHHWVRTAVRRGHGDCLLFLGRPRSESTYSEHDKKRIETLLPMLAHALGQTPESGMQSGLAQQGLESESGLILTNEDGKVLHLCSVAKKLRHMIVFPDGMSRAGHETLWHAKTAELAIRVRTLLDGQTAPPPAWRHRNAWGDFELRASPLHAEHSSDPLIAVRIRRFQPLAVHLARGLRSRTLTPRQREATLLLALGMENRDIAERMGIRPDTVAGLVKDIYLRLGVNSRSALRDSLLGEAADKPLSIIEHLSERASGILLVPGIDIGPEQGQPGVLPEP